MIEMQVALSNILVGDQSMCKRKRYNISPAIAVLLVLQSVAASLEFAGGTGEPNDPYQIATAEQLLSIGSEPTLMDKHFVLVNDIDLDPNGAAGQVFDGPVIAGDITNPFAGVLDGNGHSILNFTVEADSLFGLFGWVGSEGRVRDLGLIDVRISGTKGGALAVRNGGTIEDCHVSGSIDGSSDVGGMVGENRGFIAGCHSACGVTGMRHVGGLVGRSRGASVSRSYATGLVAGDTNVGGLIGDVRETVVSRCYATGEVSGSREVGGLLGGASYTAISYCYATGAVEGNDRVGGGLSATPRVHPWAGAMRWDRWKVWSGQVGWLDRLPGSFTRVSSSRPKPAGDLTTATGQR
jgi:hypothetical protein